VQIEWVVVAGCSLLRDWRWVYLKKPPTDMLRKHRGIFWRLYLKCLSVKGGLHNIGLTKVLIDFFHPIRLTCRHY